MIRSIDIVEIIKKSVKFNKKSKYFENGINNDYPERSRRLKCASVTASGASQIMTEYMIGLGFGDDLNDFIINEEKKTKLYDFAVSLASCLVDERGCYIHFDVTIDLEKTTEENIVYKYVNPRVIPFNWARIGKKDDHNYNQKILLSRDFSDKKIDIMEVDVFNENQKVIHNQFNKKGFKGQILFYNYFDQYHYPLSRIDAVMDDCDSEAQSAIYKNVLLRRGFYGKTVVLVRSLIGEDISKEDNEGNITPEYSEAESEAKKVKDTITEFVGAENAGGALVIETDFAGEDLDKAIAFKNVDSSIDPDLYQNVETSVRENILIAYNNLPIELIRANQAIFSSNSETLREMKRSYWENTVRDRNRFLNLLTKVYNIISGLDTKLTITPHIDLRDPNESADDDPEQERLKAQATLRGSVGGVTALVGSIVTGVSQELLTFEAGVNIIKNIYGFSEQQAKDMIGQPIQTPIETTQL